MSNSAPSVSITGPANGTSVAEGTAIDFLASAADDEDGDLSASLNWNSNIDGDFGAGSNVNATLSVGVHTIVASVTDSGGLPGSGQVTVTVAANIAPSVSITGPADGTSVARGTAIDFLASATDDEDGDLSASLNWNSNIDGDFGIGSNVNTTLSVGVHTIVASVTDSGGLSGSQQIALTVNAPGDFFVYQAKQGGSSVDELYMVDYANLGSSTKINGPLVSGGSVTKVYQISDDGMKVLYLAQEDSVGIIELYMVDLTNPGVSTKLNSDLASGGDVTSFILSSDGTKVLYRADQDTDDVTELYTVDLDVPRVSTKVNAALVPPEGDVIQFRLTADATQAVYLADQATDKLFELYTVDLANPGQATKLNPTPTGSIDISFTLSPDGTKVLYIAADTNLVSELYTVDLANPGQATKLNPTLVAGGDVASFKISADSTQVVYRADQDADQIFEIYTVSLASPSTPIKLNDDVGLDGDVFSDFQITADGTQVFYRADQDFVNMDELYKVDLANPGVSVKVNDGLITGGSVGAFEINLDGTQVVYRADQDTDNINELYKVDLAGATPSMSIKVTPLLNPFTRLLGDFQFSADGLRIVYEADEEIDGVYELYTVDLANPGLATKVNDGPLSGFGVEDWKLWP